MLVLGIETSCDETSVALVMDGRKVLWNTIGTSRSLFERSGGVIPEEAARHQVETILPVLHDALKQANVQPSDVDAIAATIGPGLLGSLIVGTTAARTLAALWQKPFVPVHHTLGHLTSTWLYEGDESPAPQFPVLTLSASGGHTDLWYREAHTRGRLLGRTRDDAAGEAFDKGAHLLGLPYPGGPAIAKVALEGHSQAFPFPLPLRDEPDFDYSFAGLKTALKYTLRDTPAWQTSLSDIAASYQDAICLHLIDRLERAAHAYPTAEVHVVGGVAANLRLRELLKKRLPERIIRTPSAIQFCTDNAAMIAAAAFFQANEHMHPAETGASATLPLDAFIKKQ